MKPVAIRPTRLDVDLADGISRYARPAPEKLGRALSWGADEHLLVVAAALVWIYGEATDADWRPSARHALVVAGVSAIVPHILKRLFNQTRPDRLTVRGHWRGVRFSGNRKDAFPSDHAVHMGALASAAGDWPEPTRSATRATAVALSAARVLVQAHWLSDVVTGFGLGVVLERLVRLVTRPGGAPGVNDTVAD